MRGARRRAFGARHRGSPRTRSRQRSPCGRTPPPPDRRPVDDRRNARTWRLIQMLAGPKRDQLEPVRKLIGHERHIADLDVGGDSRRSVRVGVRLGAEVTVTRSAGRSVSVSLPPSRVIHTPTISAAPATSPRPPRPVGDDDRPAREPTVRRPRRPSRAWPTSRRNPAVLGRRSLSDPQRQPELRHGSLSMILHR